MYTELFYATVTPLQNENIFQHYYDDLPPFRKTLANKYKFQKDKILSVAAWHLLEKAYKLCKNTKIPAVKFNQYGKCDFENGNLHFNLSHSCDFVICALSSQECGCDIEKIREIDLTLAKRFFSSDENAFLDTILQNRKIEMFYEIWVCKESFLKAKGTGLFLPLADFSVAHIDKTFCKPKMLSKVDDITIFSLDFLQKQNYKIAVAVKTPPPIVPPQKITVTKIDL